MGYIWSQLGFRSIHIPQSKIDFGAAFRLAYKDLSLEEVVVIDYHQLLI